MHHKKEKDMKKAWKKCEIFPASGEIFTASQQTPHSWREHCFQYALSERILISCWRNNEKKKKRIFPLVVEADYFFLPFTNIEPVSLHNCISSPNLGGLGREGIGAGGGGGGVGAAGQGGVCVMFITIVLSSL